MKQKKEMQELVKAKENIEKLLIKSQSLLMKEQLYDNRLYFDTYKYANK